jgi:hypothetical protein
MIAEKIKAKTHLLGKAVDEAYDMQKIQTRAEISLALLSKHFLQKQYKDSGSKEDFKEFVKKHI